MTLDILYVIGSLDRGGAETHLLRILPKLDREKFRSKILLLSHEGALADKFRSQGIELVTPWLENKKGLFIFEGLHLCLVWAQVFLYFLTERPAVVHFFLPKNYLVAGPLSVLCALPFRIMSRRSLNTYQQKYPSFLRKLEHWLHSRMDVVLGNSQCVVDQLIMEEGVKPECAKLLYNGLSLEKASSNDIRAELDLSKDSLVFVIVANLIPYKGHADLLEAFSKVNIEGGWDLLIVGNDSTHIQCDLEAQAEILNIASHVHFLGVREDVSDVLHCADVGLLTSHEEGFSNAILECMAAGLPMIVTDVGGNGEAVLNGNTGLVVSARDPSALAGALQQLSDDAELRMCFGKAARLRQEEKFSLSACVLAYEKIYKNA